MRARSNSVTCVRYSSHSARLLRRKKSKTCSPSVSATSSLRSIVSMASARLPGSLSEAIDVMERSELVAETLGEQVFDFFLRNKRAEWQAYRSEVTPFELGRYLPVL